MTNFNYELNVPNGPDNPSADWPSMRTNTNSTSGIIAVDHNGFGINNGGYHTDIHMVPQSTPSPIVGIGQLYTKNVTVGATTDTQLFYETGLGGTSQLTGNNASTNGYQWLGGVLMQWGKFTTGTGTNLPGSGTLTFPMAFPISCFNVQLTFLGNSGSGQTIQIKTIGSPPVNPSVTTANFDWIFTGGSSNSYSGFFWLAIGN